jgi:hypothetical protein
MSYEAAEEKGGVYCKIVARSIGILMIIKLQLLLTSVAIKFRMELGGGICGKGV